MKKCSLKAVFKTYGFIEYLFMSAIFAVFAFISFDTIGIFNKISLVENFVTGFTLLGLILVPCVGFTGLKEEKVSTFDFIRETLIFGLLLSVGAVFAGKFIGHDFLDNPTSKITLLKLGIACLSFVVLMVQHFVRGKVEVVENIGPKAYFGQMFAKYNLVVLSIVGVLVGCALCYLISNTLLVQINLKNLVVGALLALLLVQLVFANSKAKNYVTLVDYVSIAGLISLAIVIAFRGFLLTTSNLVLLGLLECSVIAITYIRAISYTGEVQVPTNKVKKYTSAVAKKYDLFMPFVLLTCAFIVAMLIFTGSSIGNKISSISYVSTVVKLIENNIEIVGGGLVAFAVLLVLVLRGFKKNRVVALDYVIISMLICAALACPYIPKTILTHGNLIVAAVCVFVLVVSLIMFAVRVHNFNKVTEEEADELSDEYAEDDEESVEETREEIVIDENVTDEELATDMETLVAEEEVHELELLDGVEETTEEAAEEVVEEAVQEEVTEEVAEETVQEEVVEETVQEEVAEEPVQEEATEETLDDIEEVSDEELEEELDDEDEEEIDLSDVDSIDITNENGTRERSILTPSIKVVDEDGSPKKINRKFMSRMMFASVEAKEFYNEAKNYLMMYRAKSRLSSRCETFRYKGIMAKIVLAGKSVKAYLAISPKDLEGTKYHYKDVSEKSVYTEVPVLVKIASKRGLKHFKELVDFMMSARQVKPKRNFVPVDYLPELIPNGEAILDSIGLGSDYIYDHINVKSVPADIPDDLENIIPAIAGTQLAEDSVEISIYLDTLCTYFEDGEVVTLEVLKERRVLRYGDVLKVKARGTLDRKLTIYADSFEPQALKMLMCTNCRAIKIVR